MRAWAVGLSLVLLAAGCSGDPVPVPAAAPVVTNDSLKELLTTVATNGSAGSAIQQIRIGVDESGKADLKKDVEELAKADSAGQRAKVKQLAEKIKAGL